MIDDNEKAILKLIVVITGGNQCSPQFQCVAQDRSSISEVSSACQNVQKAEKVHLLMLNIALCSYSEHLIKTFTFVCLPMACILLVFSFLYSTYVSANNFLVVYSSINVQISDVTLTCDLHTKHEHIATLQLYIMHFRLINFFAGIVVNF